MNITVIGTGYVGLVTGVILSDVGHNIVCMDIDKNKIDELNRGNLPIFEPGLNEKMEMAVSNSNLRFTSDIVESLKDAEVVFIAVGTPPTENGSADIQYVMKAAKDVASYATGNLVLVLKSTVPVGTWKKVSKIIKEELQLRNKTHIIIDVCSNPEFLREGSAVMDFLYPDRIVIGIDSTSWRSMQIYNVMYNVYEPILLYKHNIRNRDESAKFILVTPVSAEMIKYASNSMLATRISFMNSIAELCEKVGADVDMVRSGIASDSRIGSEFLTPGPGYGGSCFPKDIKALISTFQDAGADASLLIEVERRNEIQKNVLTQKLIGIFGYDLHGMKVAIWGLSFKPNTDDVRESPSINIVTDLLKLGAEVHVHDPQAMENFRFNMNNLKYDEILPISHIVYQTNKYRAIEDAHALILVTDWEEYKCVSLVDVQGLFKFPSVIIDGRAIEGWEKQAELSGMIYQRIGK